MDFQAILAKRRDGLPHSREELVALAQGAADGSIPDYQLAAWLMAAYLHPLGEDETVWLTLAMAESGERLDLTGLPKPWLDKHSTGGVGDKTSLVVLPILAACGLTVVKMSGRGLGITGGTIDKLESIPGFRTDLSPAEMKAQASKIGLAITGATPDLAPADKVLYGLRDTTGTVASLPLIVSSILSKKIAGGAETVVLDVKCGSGAFMKTLPEAKRLSDALVRTATLAGLTCQTAITDMDQPLGSAVGNALEVLEAARVLQPGSPEGAPGSAGSTARFERLCLGLAGLALHAAGLCPTRDAGEETAREAIRSGRAAAKFDQWLRAQGADGSGAVFTSVERSPVRQTVVHPGEPAWIERIDAEKIGEIVVDLGGGRKTKSDPVDHSVGLELAVSVGSRVDQGQPLFTVHAKNAADAQEAIARVQSAIVLSSTEVSPPRLFLD